MEANELRIGNLVYTVNRNTPVNLPYPHPLKIMTIEISGCCVLSPDKIPAQEEVWPKYPFFDLCEIPLTEEWFLKFGGISYGGWIGIKKTIQVWDEQVEFTFELMDEILTIYANDTRILKINNPIVHSFQNLYFALTGEELIIKLWKQL